MCCSTYRHAHSSSNIERASQRPGPLDGSVGNVGPVRRLCTAEVATQLVGDLLAIEASYRYLSRAATDTICPLPGWDGVSLATQLTYWPWL